MIKTKIKKIVSKLAKSQQVKLLRQHPLQSAGLIGFIFITANFIWLSLERKIELSYGGNTCINDVTWLPNLSRAQTNETYDLKTEANIGIGKFAFLSRKTCVEIHGVPEENTDVSAKLSLLNLGILSKKYSINTGTHPGLSTINNETISAKEPVEFSLDKPDAVFSYRLAINNRVANCRNESLRVICPIENLGLKQGLSYDSQVQKYFKDQKISDLLARQVRIVEPVIIEGSSIKKLIYDKPKDFKIIFNKDLSSVIMDFSQLKDSSEQNVDFTQHIEKNKLIIKPVKPLQRNTKFEIKLTSAIATDKGTLPEPYKIKFKMSDGPKVTGVNIGIRSVSPGTPIVIKFDQKLKPDQNFKKLLHLTSNGNPMPFTLSQSSQSITLRPTAGQGLCSKIHIVLEGGVVSKYDIKSDNSWSYSSRIICYSIRTIGHSVFGRAINAWSFGSGSKKILFLGGTHGNEKSSKYLMDRWISELEANPYRIPKDKTIVIIPNLNPDGFASSSRLNAHKVDLNRNFPHSNWKDDVTIPGGEVVKNGGGEKPLSEPESTALANYVKSQGFDLVISYHAVASLVTPNLKSKAESLAKVYSLLSGYRYLPFSDLSKAFEHDVTGAFEDWAAEKLGLPVFVVELGSMSYSEFERNQSALWKMIVSN